MINPTEVLTILQVNGLNKTSSLDSVMSFLNQMKYSEEEKTQVIEMLKSQEWRLPKTATEALPNYQSQTVDIVPVKINTEVPPVTEAPVFSTPSVSSQLPPQTPIVQKSSKKGIVYLIVILVLILLAGAVAYAYVEKIGPFSSPKYTEDNFSSSILSKIAKIDTATYTFSGAINVVPRDADAVPFTLKVSNSEEFKKKYYYDYNRANDVVGIVRYLNSKVGYFRGMKNTNSVKKYPSVLSSISNNSKKTTDYSYDNFSINDPETGTEYDYQSIDNGNDFNLTATFSTDDAIKEIKRQSKTSTSTIFNGNKVTFNKNSSTYMYLDQEPPKPFLSQMSDSMQMLPPEINAKIVMTASSDFKSQNSAEGSFNLDAGGTMGDLTFKINLDALKKDSNYYFRINNIPSFFLFDQLSAVKGKWIIVPSKNASSTSSSTDSIDTNNSPLSFLKDSIPEQEAEMKKNREKFSKLIQKVVKIADEEKIIVFKSNPKSEKVNGRNLVKYDISIRKDKILSFYSKVQDAINSDPDLADFSKDIDQGYINYLKSDEFSQVFDYFDKNNTLTLWTDTDGYPAILKNVMRVVPPDSAEQLKKNQINLTFELDVSNINKPINIQVPENAVPLDKILQESKSSEAGNDGK